MKAPLQWPAWVLPALAIALAALSLTPFAVWWAGADPRYFTTSWAEWGWGTVVGLGMAALVMTLSRGRAVVGAHHLWRYASAQPSARRFILVTGLVLAALALLTCLIVFAGNPRTVDGFADLFQARIFLAGRLWAPPPPADVAANFSTLHMIVGPARWFSQYPPGEASVLAAGLALGAWWLLNPVFAVALVIGTYRVARWCCDEPTARLASVLLCLSPFVVAMSGSELSHFPAAALGMLAAAAATRVGEQRWRSEASLAGAALAAMAAFRPLDAVAAAVPAGLVVVLAAPPRRRAGALGLVAASGALLSLPILWYNSRTTGSWLEFGYSFLWGPELGLGFHPVLWGTALTPARAVALTGLDLHQLNVYLFDAPFPFLVFLAVGLTLGRRALAARDVVPLTGVLGLMAIFFFYWHRDVFYGPRFLFTAVPWFAVLGSRALVVLGRAGRRELYPGVTIGRAAAFGFGVILMLGLVTITPGRMVEYHRGTPVFNLHPARDARRAGITHALVVIPDGWGSRLIARMWALGVAPRYSTRLYAAIDACTLEQALDRAALDSAARARLPATLDSLVALGRPGVLTAVTEDHNLRLPRLPAGAMLAPACRSELSFDAQGFLAFAPFLYLNRPTLDGDIVWARDLGRWNGSLLAHYRDRKLYRYAPQESGGPPVFTPLEREAESRGIE